MPRKPIAVEWVTRPNAEDETGQILVVCDDGSAWTHTLHTDSWHQLPSIPGSGADNNGKSTLAVKKLR